MAIIGGEAIKIFVSSEDSRTVQNIPKHEAAVWVS